jgi:hypothetical protein
MAEQDAVLVPVEERIVAFYEDELMAVAVQAGGERRVYVPIKPISDYLGLSWSGQYERIMRDEVLSEVAQLIRVTRINPGVGNPELLALPIEYLHGWMFGISANRVREELREKIQRYRRECYHVLWEAFRPDQPALSETSEAMMRAMRDNALQQARLWETLLSEQQRLRATETLVQEHDDLLWEAFRQLESLRQQQSQIEARYSDLVRLLPAPSDPIDPAQKAAIKALVDDLVAAAQEQGVRLGQGRNDYPAVWDAFKRRFDLAKYDELSTARYEEAVTWLKTWLDRIRTPSDQTGQEP